YEYSNTNYLLLAETMDRVLGYPNFQFIQTEILDRLNLKNTYRSIHDVDLQNLMSGYHIGHPYDLKEDDVGMVATAEDVGIFVRALNDDSIFDEGEKEIYTSIYELEHTGLVPGYQSIARYHEDIDAVVVQFMNTTNFEGYHWNISEMVYNRIVKIIKENP
ncbi:MAG: beta-lactamase family protein, partial [Schleiferiaceae bacterium]|nr:beta-lactamase family protein [Schleiferiaceae bacterium]